MRKTVPNFCSLFRKAEHEVQGRNIFLWFHFKNVRPSESKIQVEFGISQLPNFFSIQKVRKAVLEITYFHQKNLRIAQKFAIDL